MIESVKLYVVELDVIRARSLALSLASVPSVSVAKTYAEAVAQSGGLDAVMVPLMSALEWGISSVPPVPHKTAVLRMPPAQVAKGRPKFAIPGIALHPGENLEAVQSTKLVLREILRAVRRFNARHTQPVLSVGVSALGLGLDRLKIAQAAHLLNEAVQSAQTHPLSLPSFNTQTHAEAGS